MDKNKKYSVLKFIQFVKEDLGINQDFKVILTTKRSEELKTYAYYSPSDLLIKIYCKNRGLADILRSVAHEIVHHHQNEQGALTGDIPDIGGKIEDDANSIAGQLVKKFGYANPKLAIYKG